MSRETRRLLITIAVSVTALWVLARVRFQERPRAATPVPNVLAQLRPTSDFADLARSIADIRPGIMAAVSPLAGGGTALRIREDAALTLAPATADDTAAHDRATGLTIVRRNSGDVPGLMPWAPRLLDYPRYLVAAEVAGEHLSLRPVFIGGLFPLTSPLWPGDVWSLPPSTAIAPGTFTFTTDGAFAGVAARADNRAVIVPATVLFAAVEQLQQRSGDAGDLGIAVQPLSPAIATAIGAKTGVVVTTVGGTGPAADRLVPTDVIEAINGQDLFTLDHWYAYTARVRVGVTLTMRVHNADGVREVLVTAAAPAPSPESTRANSLGLGFRSIPKIGAEVVSVQQQSRASEAGIQAGDLITVAAGRQSPTPAHIMRAYASLRDGESLVAAVTRGRTHFVAVIPK